MSEYNFERDYVPMSVYEFFHNNYGVNHVAFVKRNNEWLSLSDGKQWNVEDGVIYEFKGFGFKSDEIGTFTFKFNDEIFVVSKANEYDAAKQIANLC